MWSRVVKSEFRILVYSYMDQFATLTISEPSVNVNLLSMILQFVKKPIGEKKGENNEETTVPNGEEQITSDQIKTNHGKEQRSIDGNQDKYDKKQIGPGYEVNPDDDNFQGRLLLAEAVRE